MAWKVWLAKSRDAVQIFQPFCSPEDGEDLIIFTHCLVAEWKDTVGGPLMQSQYMNQASRFNPRLRAESYMVDMRKQLAEVRTERGFELLKKMQHDEEFNDKMMFKLVMWCKLVCFEVTDDLKVPGNIFEKTMQLFNIVTGLLQETQLVTDNFLELLIPCKDQLLSRMVVLYNTDKLCTTVLLEVDICDTLKNNGLALRCATKFI